MSSPMRAFALSFAALALVACSSSSSRSSFQEEEAAPTFGTGDSFGNSPVTPTTTSCATASAEAERPPVDVIVSVDQSASMSEEIANIKANINRLSSFLENTGLDYRVVLIGTVGNGTFDLCVPPPLGGPSCGPNGTKFLPVNRNVQSTDTLDIILSTFDAGWKGFLRPDSLKIFVPITDDNSYTQATSFDASLLAKPGGYFGTAAARRYVFYPITGAAAFPSESMCGSSPVNNGSQYLSLAKLTKGKWFPICSSDFAPLFEGIGQSVAATVACELKLPERDDLDLDRVNVKVTTPDGKTTDVLQDSGSCESGANGWQYNADKTKIVLCGSACAAVSAKSGTKVEVELGCETRVR